LVALAATLLASALLPAAASAQTAGTQAAPMGAARLRVLNLAAFATPGQGIRVLVDGYPLTTALGLGASSAYSTLTAGTHHVQIFNGATGMAVLDARPRLLNGNDYTYLIEGRLTGKVYPVLSTDDNTAVMAGQARVRFANAIPNGLAVQARIRGTDAAFRTTSFTGLSAYHTVTAGTYTLDIMSLNGQVLTSLVNIPLASGQVYTLLATGLNTAATVTAAAQQGSVVVSSAAGSQITGAPISPAPAAPNAAPTAALRLVDLVPATATLGSLVLAVDGRAVFGAIGYGGATAYVSLPAGPHRVQVTRSTGGAVAVDTTVTLTPKSTFSLVIHQRANGGYVGTLSTADNTAVPATMARVRFSNMAAAGQLLRAALIGATAFPTTPADGFTNYVNVPAGRYILQVYAKDGTVLTTLPNVVLSAGQVSTLFAADLSGKPGTAPVLAVSATGGQFLTLPAFPAPQQGGPAVPAPVVAPQQAMTTLAHLRVINLIRSPLKEQVTFYLDGQLFTAPLDFNGSTAFVTRPAGQHRFQVVDTLGRLVVNTPVILQAGQTYTFATEGMQGGAIAWALLSVATAASTASQASVRFANAIAGSGVLTASFVNGIKLGGAAFGAAGSYQSVPAGAYDLQVRTLAGQGVQFVRGITLQAGKAYTIFVTAAQGASTTMGGPITVLNGQ